MILTKAEILKLCLKFPGQNVIGFTDCLHWKKACWVIWILTIQIHQIPLDTHKRSLNSCPTSKQLPNSDVKCIKTGLQSKTCCSVINIA